MKIINAAFVSLYDPLNVESWSGIPYHMCRSLERVGFQFEYICPLPSPLGHPFGSLVSSVVKLKQLYYGRICGKAHLYEYDPLVLMYAWTEARRRVSISKADIILSCEPLSISCLDSKIPIAMWHDSIFSDLVNFYPFFTNLSKSSLHSGNLIQRNALSKVKAVAYTSDWAMKSAIRQCGIKKPLMQVIPFGANLSHLPNDHQVHEMISNRSNNCCYLLLIGRGWNRKGCDVAVRVAEELNGMGLKTELSIVGSFPPKGIYLPDFIRLEGDISKTTPEGCKRMWDLYARANFFILPAHSDCTPVALSEAGAFGLPALTSNIAGIPSIIHDGINGKMFHFGSSAHDYASYIYNIMLNSDCYQDLEKSTRREYSGRLNWDLNAEKFLEMCKKII